MPAIKGTCRCGKVHYESTAEPIFTGICHCKSCQKVTGAPFVSVVAVPEPSLTVTGEMKQFDTIGDSGKPVHRRFCPDCGSSVTMFADLMPGVIMLPVGTLDDADWVKPTMQIYCDSAQPWVSLGGDMARFPKMPTPA